MKSNSYYRNDAINAEFFGASGDSFDDCAAPIQAALNSTAGGTVYLPAGTFYLNSGTLSVATAGTALRGAGPGLTTMVVGPGITGSQLVSLTADYCEVSDMTIAGVSATTTSNPACDAIGLNGGRYNRVDNVDFRHVNGWCVNSIATPTKAGFATMLTRLSSYQNCAGGIHIQSNATISNGGQHFLSNINMQQVGVNSGANAGMDAFLFEDVFDLTCVNLNGAVSQNSVNGSTYGACMHIRGNCAAIYIVNADLGAFPRSAGINNPVWLIEDFGGNSPHNVQVLNSIGQQGAYGLRITGGAKDLAFIDFEASNNYNHGVSVEGNGSTIDFDRLRCSSNGQNGTGTNYDLNWSGTAGGKITNTTLSSPVVAINSGVGVQNPAHFNSNNGVVANNWDCNGSGTSATNVFDSTANSPNITRNVRPWNPRGGFTTTPPASGTPTAPVGSDKWFYVTAATGGCGVSVTGATAFAMTIPAGVTLPVFVAAQQTMTLTYTSTPSYLGVAGL